RTTSFGKEMNRIPSGGSLAEMPLVKEAEDRLQAETIASLPTLSLGNRTGNQSKWPRRNLGGATRDPDSASRKSLACGNARTATRFRRTRGATLSSSSGANSIKPPLANTVSGGKDG